VKRMKKVLSIVSLLICFLLLFACSKKLDTVEQSNPESIHESETDTTTTGSSESMPESKQSVEESKESSAASSEETTFEQTSEGTENATEATTGGETTVKTEKPSEAQVPRPTEPATTTSRIKPVQPSTTKATEAPPVETTKPKPTVTIPTKPTQPATTNATTTKPTKPTKPSTTPKATEAPPVETTKPEPTVTVPTQPPTQPATTTTKPPTTTTTTTQDPSVEYWDSDKMFVGEEYFWGEKDGKKIYVRGILNKTGKKASETINQVAFNKINEYRQSHGLNTLVRNTAVQSGADRAASIIAARAVQVGKTGHIYSGYDAALTYIIVNGMSDQRLGEEAALAFIESPAHAEILKWPGTKLSVATWRFNDYLGDEIALIISID